MGSHLKHVTSASMKCVWQMNVKNSITQMSKYNFWDHVSAYKDSAEMKGAQEHTLVATFLQAFHMMA